MVLIKHELYIRLVAWELNMLLECLRIEENTCLVKASEGTCSHVPLLPFSATSDILIACQHLEVYPLRNFLFSDKENSPDLPRVLSLLPNMKVS
jgi:hypothetical protein